MKTKIALVILLGGFALPAAAFDFGNLKDMLQNSNPQQLKHLLQEGKKVSGEVKTATEDVSVSEEIQMGDQISSNLLGAAPLLPDPVVQHYVNDVGRWLSLHTERPDLPWQFAVLNDEDVNAFAAPGGRVFITKGLLEHMHSEAELAGVLAHEISHVLCKHHLKAIKKDARTNLMTGLAGEVVREKGGNQNLIKLANIGTGLYARGLDKNDEYQADRMGVVIATRSGYDPYGLPAVLQTLETLNPKDSRMALMFKTHPSLSSRLDMLNKEMSGHFSRFEDQPDLTARFDSAMRQGGIHLK